MDAAKKGTAGSWKFFPGLHLAKERLSPSFATAPEWKWCPGLKFTLLQLPLSAGADKAQNE